MGVYLDSTPEQNLESIRHNCHPFVQHLGRISLQLQVFCIMANATPVGGYAGRLDAVHDAFGDSLPGFLEGQLEWLGPFEWFLALEQVLKGEHHVCLEECVGYLLHEAEPALIP